MMRLRFWKSTWKMQTPEIYACRADCDKETFDKMLSYVRDDKRERILNQKNAVSACEMLAGELLMMYAVRDSFGISPKNAQFYKNKYGKLYLKNVDNAYFNISHSGGAAICAVFEREIGADIQKISRYNPSLAKKMCNEEELELLNSSDNKDYAFSLLWCKKEAYHKLLGTGISYPNFAKSYDCSFKFYDIFDMVAAVAWR